MTVTEAGVGGLVRVTVVSGEKRRDLALPSAVAVAEMLPEIARSIGALDASKAHLGFRLVAANGSDLAPTAGLSYQNIHDGAVLTLTVGSEPSPRVYDDVVEAMADVVEGSTTPWKPESARRTALVAAGGLLTVGAIALGLERVSVLSGALSAVIALVLLAAATVLSRLEDEHEIALMLVWTAAAYAAVGAFTGIDGVETLGAPLCAAGAAAAGAAALGAAGVSHQRLMLLPAVVIGALVAAASGIVTGTDLDPAAVYLVAAMLVVVAAGLQPALARAAAGASAPPPEDPSAVPDDPDEIAISDVREGARIGHDVLLAATVTSGLVLALTAPLAVTLGLTGAVAIALAGAVLLIRTRLFRSGTEVAVGLISGSAALLSTAVSVVVLQPGWRPGLIIVLIIAAAGTLVGALVPSTASVSRGRTAEVVEVISLVALAPLTIIAIGVLSAVRS